MTTMTEQMTNMGKVILEDIRKTLVIPYIKETDGEYDVVKLAIDKDI